MATTRFCPSGEESSSWRRFSAKTRIASSSAFSLAARELFGLDRGAYQAFERVGHGRFHPFARRRAGPYEQPAETFDAMFGIHVDRDFQDALLLAAAHGQEAV